MELETTTAMMVAPSETTAAEEMESSSYGRSTLITFGEEEMKSFILFLRKDRALQSN